MTNRVGTNYFTKLNSSVNISLTNESGNAILCDCTGDPNTIALTSNVFITGCVIIRTDITSGNNIYQNQGSITSPSWIPLGGTNAPFVSTSVISLPKVATYAAALALAMGTVPFLVFVQASSQFNNAPTMYFYDGINTGRLNQMASLLI